MKLKNHFLKLKMTLGKIFEFYKGIRLTHIGCVKSSIKNFGNFTGCPIFLTRSAHKKSIGIELWDYLYNLILSYVRRPLKLIIYLSTRHGRMQDFILMVRISHAREVREFFFRTPFKLLASPSHPSLHSLN